MEFILTPAENKTEKTIVVKKLIIYVYRTLIKVKCNKKVIKSLNNEALINFSIVSLYRSLHINRDTV